MRAELTLAAALALCVGCAHVETRVLRLGRAAPPLRADAAVVVRAPPLPASSMPAREVALLEVTSDGATDRVAVVRALRQAARQVGADVVLWMHEDVIEGFGRVIASAVRTGRAGP